MLLRIAHALGVQDLADLTGNGHAVPVSVFAGERHKALTEVQAALTDYHLLGNAPPPNVEHLAIRLEQAWQIRHASPDHRTQLGLLLPDLIRDSQRAVRVIRGEKRRAPDPRSRPRLPTSVYPRWCADATRCALASKRVRDVAFQTCCDWLVSGESAACRTAGAHPW